MSPAAKYILICLVMIASGDLASAQNSFAAFEDVKPKGKVDSVIIKSKSIYNRTYVYNKRGQLTDYLCVSKDMPTDTLKWQYFYDKNERLVSSAMIVGGKRQLARYEYIKRQSGYAFRSVDSAAKTDSSLVYEIRYNNLKQVVACGYYALNNPEHQTSGNIEYKYDIKGNVIEKVTHYDKPFSRFYKYDNDGEMTMITKDDPHEEWYLMFKYSDYDEMRNWRVQTSQTQSGYENGTYITTTRHITYYK